MRPARSAISASLRQRWTPPGWRRPISAPVPCPQFGREFRPFGGRGAGPALVPRCPEPLRLHPDQPEIAPAGAEGDIALVEQHRPQPLADQPPGDGGAHQPAAHHDRVRAVVPHRGIGRYRRGAVNRRILVDAPAPPRQPPASARETPHEPARPRHALPQQRPRRGAGRSARGLCRSAAEKRRHPRTCPPGDARRQYPQRAVLHPLPHRHGPWRGLPAVGCRWSRIPRPAGRIHRRAVRPFREAHHRRGEGRAGPRHQPGLGRRGGAGPGPADRRALPLDRDGPLHQQRHRGQPAGPGRRTWLHRSR